jgi:hypothetical protein
MVLMFCSPMGFPDMVNDRSLSQRVGKSFRAATQSLKDHPAVAVISVAGTLLGVIAALPSAVSAIEEIGGWPKCLHYSASYRYATGVFQQTGKDHWTERDIENVPPTFTFEFKELYREREYITIQNLTFRPEHPQGTMLVRIPVCGGTIQLTYENPQRWIDLYQSWPE